jgi:pyridoxine 5-phosphate synthase
MVMVCITKEFNIGHYIIGESIFYGFRKTIKNFKDILKKKK